VTTGLVDRVAVVIPARNEEARLGGCLHAVRAAVRRLRSTEPSVAARVVVVLDDCTDASSAMLRRFPEVREVTSTAGRVGAARHLGIHVALRDLDADPARCWIASSDADSLVSPNWLTTHLALARQGAELVLGTILPDRADLPSGTFDRWLHHNPQRDGHPYVHGANLGVRGDAYLRAGGFPAVAEHEDVQLTAAVRRTGGQVVSTASCPVVTSGRTVGRTPGGFAGYLAALAQ
jgi:glycosyltransferase involved in cell wall biosynthesis